MSGSVSDASDHHELGTPGLTKYVVHKLLQMVHHNSYPIPVLTMLAYV